MADYKEFEGKMKKTLDFLGQQFDTVRAGRANAAVLDQIQVNYYGSPTPIQQLASVSTPDPRTLMIQPWDGSVLRDIEKAILASELGINPQNDGKVIRLVFPQLTEERRKQLVKQCGKEEEQAKVSVRNGRRDIIDKLKKGIKAGLAEDAEKDAEDKLQKLHDRYIKKIEELLAAKEKEIMTV